MSEVKIKLLYRGFNELRKSAEVVDECKRHAENALVNLGEGYEIEPRSTSQRSGYAIRTNSYESMLDNEKNNSLAKAVLGG